MSESVIASLAQEPTRQYPQFKRDIYNEASNICVQHYENGLNSLFVTLTARQYAALGAVDDDNDPIPRPQLPTKPGQLAGTPTNNALAIFKQSCKEFSDVSVGINKLKSQTLIACGMIIRDQLEAMQNGIAGHTLLSIMEYLELTYGTATSVDFAAQNKAVRDPFTTPSAFRGEAAAFQLKLATLQNNGAGWNEIQKMEAFEEVTAKVAGVADCIRRYKIRKQLPLDQRVHELIAEVNTTLPMATAGDLGYANASVGLTASDVEAIATACFTKALAKQQPGKGKPKSKEKDKPKCYCFVHGYGGHTGEQCLTMKDNPNFTYPMKKATAPATA